MLHNNRQLSIATAGSRKATSWQPSTLWWSELVARLRVPVRGTETVEAYFALGKSEQDDLKDVGGFVGGTLAQNRRKAGHVLGRDLLTLDVDSIPAGGTHGILQALEALGCAYAVYSTRKHRPDAPRLRVIWMPDRLVSPDEYEPLLRKMAELSGLIAYSDPTTFQTHRLMYWPSCCANGEYVFQYGDKPFLSVDGVLALYSNWHDISAWPQVSGATPYKVLAARQGNPTDKEGIVGAFCRTYDIYTAMDKFLLGLYDPTDLPDRYSYTGGSTTGGAMVYDNGLFLYSHHATDPCGGKLVNAFDLVRLHCFAEQDAEAADGTPVNRLPSYLAMREFALTDSAVSGLLSQERHTKATEAFANSTDMSAPSSAPVNTDWMRRLAVNTQGTVLKTTNNILIILDHDPRLQGKLATDKFSGRGMAVGALPWNAEDESRWWSDHDDAGLRHYLETFYNISAVTKTADACILAAEKNAYDDVCKYLKGLIWDEVPRLDTLFIDYLGAEDSAYTRAVTRKSLTAAVARVLNPGCKYDYMPILGGAQGLGKSTLLRKLGGAWFSDALEVFSGKEAAEMLRGVWINELGELSGMSKAETDCVKAFISRQIDIYREPFGHRTTQFLRRCVFFGTSNNDSYLKDTTGNRRFWPIDVGIVAPTKSVFRDLDSEVDQIWAEAIRYFKAGEALFLSPELEREAGNIQEGHREVSGKEGIIREFLERPVPLDWDKWELDNRRMYWLDKLRQPVPTEPRRRVCAMEVWFECLGGELKSLQQRDSKEINAIIAHTEGWLRRSQAARYGPYGVARGGYEAITVGSVTVAVT